MLITSKFGYLFRASHGIRLAPGISQRSTSGWESDNRHCTRQVSEDSGSLSPFPTFDMRLSETQASHRYGLGWFARGPTVCPHHRCGPLQALHRIAVRDPTSSELGRVLAWRRIRNLIIYGVLPPWLPPPPIFHSGRDDPRQGEIWISPR
jgi:hypothetical protein